MQNAQLARQDQWMAMAGWMVQHIQLGIAAILHTSSKAMLVLPHRTYQLVMKILQISWRIHPMYTVTWIQATTCPQQ